jgi:RND family efflux transporter MFP subunit
MTGNSRSLLAIPVLLTLTACSDSNAVKSPSKEAPPAEVTGRQKESELATVKLTKQAADRLGIATVEVRLQDVRAERRIAGEAVLPPGKALMVTAPVSGTLEKLADDVTVGRPVQSGAPLFRLVPLLPLQRDLGATYEADLATAKARLDTTQLQLQRAQQLLKDGAGSQRNVEQAQQDHTQAKAAYDAASERLARLKSHPLDADVALQLRSPVSGIIRQVLSSPGQQVSSGANVFEVADMASLWIRVPVYVDDLPQIASVTQVPVDNLDPGRPDLLRTARRVSAPPSADPLAVTADLFFEVNNSDGMLRPGQKVGVRLPLRSEGRGLVAPASAVVYDAQGGTWVYVQSAPLQFTRRRVDVIRTVGRETLLARGVSPGDPVVSAGAVELFGTEFGAGK